LSTVPAMLPCLSVPTLILQGAHDKAVPELFAQRAGALIPQSTVHMVDSGHFIPLNNPEILVTELRRFLVATDVA
jgi:pimeloyl-ACP methyl ester carboxylesterase